MPPVIGLGITPVPREMRAPLAQPLPAPLISIHQIAIERPPPLRALSSQRPLANFINNSLNSQKVFARFGQSSPFAPRKDAAASIQNDVNRSTIVGFRLYIRTLSHRTVNRTGMIQSSSRSSIFPRMSPPSRSFAERKTTMGWRGSRRAVVAMSRGPRTVLMSSKSIDMVAGGDYSTREWLVRSLAPPEKKFLSALT
jgi:hypothetical protein